MKKIQFVLLFLGLIVTSCQEGNNVLTTAKIFPKQNIVFDGGDDSAPKMNLFFVIEIPKGGTFKYELRTATGSLIMDRALCPRKVAGVDRWVHGFPAHYGIVPGRFNVDGDPLDLIVWGSNEKYQKMIESKKIIAQKVRVIGIVKMEECENIPCFTDKDWIQDWKVLAIDLDHNIDKLPKNVEMEIATFFSNYKGPKKVNRKEYPQTRVTGILNQAQAHKYIEQNFPKMSKEVREHEIDTCHRLYNHIWKNQKKYTNNKSSKFLSCIQRVHWDGFLPGQNSYEFFHRYIAYQRLYSLKYKNPKFDKTFEQMGKLKNKKKTYYRYVKYDNPKPGTGQAIFEWVKTKNRNKGCQKGFPTQHYENDSLYQ